MLAHRASYDKKTLARQVIPLAPGYRTALSSRPVINSVDKTKFFDKQLHSIDAYLILRSAFQFHGVPHLGFKNQDLGKHSCLHQQYKRYQVRKSFRTSLFFFFFNFVCFCYRIDGHQFNFSRHFCYLMLSGLSIGLLCGRVHWCS